MAFRPIVRPVGSQIPLPADDSPPVWPWEADYHVEFLGSGAEALSVSIALAMADRTVCGVPEVIMPAYGCPDLVAAVVAQGGMPVLVDFVSEQPVMDERHVVSVISENTVAVLAVGFLGIPERLELLSRICKEYRVWLIEDSAQCFPPGITTSAVADCTVLSFGRGKPMNLMGGGALLIKKCRWNSAQNFVESLPCKKLKLTRVWRLKRWIFNLLLDPLGYGLLKSMPFIGIGQTYYKPINKIFRIKDFPGGLLSAGVRQHASRTLVHKSYDRDLQFLPERGWFVVGMREDTPEIYYDMPRLRYAILTPSRFSRDHVVESLNNRGVGASPFYGGILADIPGVASHLGDQNGCVYPNARSFADRLVTLPCHENVSEKVLNVVRSVLDKESSEL